MEKVKEKIAVYQRYLDIYLEIFDRLTHKFDRVRIYEPFAGDGEEKAYGGGDDIYEGSVSVAIQMIEEKLKEGKFKKGRIDYFVNDLEPEKCKKLKEKFYSPQRDWLHISNQNAHEFINEHIEYAGYIPNLWFIDPYGYTQVGKEDYEKIYSKKGSDIIIFIPTPFITRFIGSDPDKEPEKPIKELLKTWDIEIEVARQSKDIRAFEKLLVNSLKESNTDSEFYAKSYTLYFHESKNDYSLLFISRHILGAQKFLEARKMVYKKYGTDMLPPKSLIEIKPEDIIAYIGEKPRNNLELYKWGIINDLLAPELNKFVIDLLESGILYKEPYDKNKPTRMAKNVNYIAYEHFAKDAKKLLFHIKK